MMSEFKLFPTDQLVNIGEQFLHRETTVRRERNLSLVSTSLGSSTSTLAEDEIEEGLVTEPSTYGAVKNLTEGITLTWRELSVYVPQKQSWWSKEKTSKPFKRVLNNVFGAVQPGNLVALMGSSGAGKTTLMNALANRTAKNVSVEGDVLVNGFPCLNDMSRVSACVHQDDLFVKTLTVREHLNFMARMRMDSRSSKAERDAKINEIIRVLGLTKSQNTRIGIHGLNASISGGERKRLSFASEILTDPPLLFCDEPTTGLDSFNARKLVKLLKEMAARGKTIVCTIHQPSSEVFTMFDKLLLLAEGRVAYMGSSAGALEFFNSLNYKCPPTFNPADFYIHTLAVLPGHELQSKERIKRICNNFAVSTYAKDLESVIHWQENFYIVRRNSKINQLLNIESPKKPGWHIQFYWLLWRALIDSYRNPSIHIIRIFQKLAIAIVVGLCYTKTELNQAGIQNIAGVLFTFVIESVFPSMTGVLNIFPYELPVFLREYKNGIYGVGCYYLAKAFSLVPGFIVDPFVFTIACYWTIGLRRHAYNFFMTVLIQIISANVSSAFGAMFSAMFESIPYIMMVLIPINMLNLICAGFYIDLNSMSPYVSWIHYLSWFSYTNEAFTITQWSGVTNITCEFPAGTPCISNGDEVIENFAFKKSNYVWDFIIMIFMYFIFHFLGYIGLTLRTKRV